MGRPVSLFPAPLKSCGLRLENSGGERDLQLQLTGLRFSSPPLFKSEASLVLQADPNQGNQHITIRQCRFEGPSEASLLIEGSVDDVAVKQCRFWKTDTAFLFREARQLSGIQLGIESSTFCETDTIFFLPMPPVDRKGPNGKITLRGNLFARTAALVRHGPNKEDAGPIKARFAIEAGNVRDPGSCRDGAPFPDIKPMVFEPLSMDPDDALFLRYPVTSPLSRAGFQGGPAGCPPPE